MEMQDAINLVRREFPFPEIFNESRYKNIITHAADLLSPGSEILDLGAGPCEIPAILSKLGHQCTAYDDFEDEWLSRDNGRQKVFDFAKKMDVDIEFAKSNKLPFSSESFDMFMMHDVLEHLHDSPRELLNDAIDSLRPEGLLFITVPSVVNIRKRVSVLMGKTNLPDYETYYWYPGSWRGPVREYTKGDLKSMCEYLNLDIVELKGCSHMLARVPNSILPFYRMITGVFPNWKDTWLLIAQKPKGWKPRRSISNEEFEDIMDKTKWERRKKENLF